MNRNAEWGVGRLSAFTLAIGMMSAAPAVFAQTAPAEPAAAAPETTPKKADDKSVQLEAVRVTGSRIVIPGATSASPIVTVRAEEFNLQQTPEVEQVLRTLPSTLPSDGSNVNNGTAGAALINLRGLGASRNLILIDGKRLTPYDINGLVDTSQIPTALLDRVDLVNGGASAVYGSDAITGAVNFIMKRNFEGVDVRYSNSLTEQQDGDKSSLAIAMGSNVANGKGNVSAALNYSHRDGIQLGQRDLGQLGIVTADGSGLANFLGGIAPTPAPAGCDGPGAVTAGGSSTTLPTRVSIVGVPGTARQFRNDGTLGANCSVFNFNPFNYYETPQDRYGGAVFGHLEVNKHAEAYGRFLYSNTRVRQQVAPSGVFGTAFFTPLNNPLIGDQARQTFINQGEAARVAGRLNAGNYRDTNRNGVVDSPDYLNIAYRRRTVEFGERSTTYGNSTYQAVVGLQGNIIGAWDYDVSFQRGQAESNRISAGYTNLANIANAIDSTVAGVCTNGDPTCVPLNLFGGFGAITPAQAAYSSATALENRIYTQYITNATVSGSVDFARPLATRPLGLSFGVERRREAGTTTPDECLKLAPSSCLGGAGGNTLPISGGFGVNELFTEATLPLLDDLPFAKALDLNAGYRWSDYNPTGLNRTWKYGATWTPVDSVLLRASHQRAARAPNVGELAAPQTTGLANALFDPCSSGNPDAATPSQALVDRCVATGVLAADVGKIEDITAGQVNGFFGTDLQNLPSPEKADTTTFGITFRPKNFGVIRNFYASFDYYDIKITNFIGGFGAQEVLDACYVGGDLSQCGKIRRLNETLVSDGSGIQLFTTNLKVARAEGLELVTNFDVGVGSYGKVKLGLNANYYLKQESQSSTLVPVIDCKGVYGNQCGNPLPRLRVTQRTTWSVKDLDASVLWRYQGGASVENAQTASTFLPFQHIGDYSYFDASLGYTFRKKYKVSILATNLLDRQPPVVGNEAATTSSNSGNTFPSVYDTLGRSYTLGLSASF